jgi:hypothetical protein
VLKQAHGQKKKPVHAADQQEEGSAIPAAPAGWKSALVTRGVSQALLLSSTA